MIVLDALKSEDPHLRRVGETWMRCSLKSYLRYECTPLQYGSNAELLPESLIPCSMICATLQFSVRRSYHNIMEGRYKDFYT